MLDIVSTVLQQKLQVRSIPKSGRISAGNDHIVLKLEQEGGVVGLRFSHIMTDVKFNNHAQQAFAPFGT